MNTKEKDRYPKELWSKSIHGGRSLTEDGNYNVKLVAVGGGYRKKQGLVLIQGHVELRWW